jgi:hypothetical protein
MEEKYLRNILMVATSYAIQILATEAGWNLLFILNGKVFSLNTHRTHKPRIFSSIDTAIDKARELCPDIRSCEILFQVVVAPATTLKLVS